MNPVAALMPGHHLLFHAAAAATLEAKRKPRVAPMPAASQAGAPDLRKYIIGRHQDGHEAPFVFPREILHCDIGLPRDCAGGELFTAVSAGSYGVANGRVFTVGGSTTLCLDTRPQDAALIQSLFSESA